MARWCVSAAKRKSSYQLTHTSMIACCSRNLWAVLPTGRAATAKARAFAVGAAYAFSLGIAGQVLKFRPKAQMRVTPPAHRTPHSQ